MDEKPKLLHERLWLSCFLQLKFDKGQHIQLERFQSWKHKDFILQKSFLGGSPENLRTQEKVPYSKQTAKDYISLLFRTSFLLQRSNARCAILPKKVYVARRFINARVSF